MLQSLASIVTIIKLDLTLSENFEAVHDQLSLEKQKSLMVLIYLLIYMT